MHLDIKKGRVGNGVERERKRQENWGRREVREREKRGREGGKERKGGKKRG